MRASQETKARLGLGPDQAKPTALNPKMFIRNIHTSTHVANTESGSLTAVYAEFSRF